MTTVIMIKVEKPPPQIYALPLGTSVLKPRNCVWLSMKKRQILLAYSTQHTF